MRRDCIVGVSCKCETNTIKALGLWPSVKALARTGSGQGRGIDDAMTVDVAQMQLLRIPGSLTHTSEQSGAVDATSHTAHLA